MQQEGLSDLCSSARPLLLLFLNILLRLVPFLLLLNLRLVLPDHGINNRIDLAMDAFVAQLALGVSSFSVQ